MNIVHTDLYSLGEYGKHLKNLPDDDKYSRFGAKLTDYAIDQMMLNMVYNPDDHELWYVRDHAGNHIGFGHMARNRDDTWELAVSVNKSHQRQGVGDKLIEEMLAWAKFHKISEVFMQCIENNKVIQHLAEKHELKTRERGHGERTAAIEVPEPNPVEFTSQLFKEQADIIQEITELRGKLISLWFNRKV